MTDRSIAIVGAGVIGVTIAHELQRRGRQVTLIERNEPGRGASFGNMASIAVTEFTPASRPAMWRKIPSWTLDPDGPVRLSPTYLPRLLPWLLRFAEAGRPARVRAIEAAGAALAGRVYDDLLPLLAETGLSDRLSTEGCIGLYANDRELAADRDHLEMLDRFGLGYELLDRSTLRDLEPAISPDIGRAILFPNNRSIRDPYALVMALYERFRASGGRFVQGNAIGFDRSGEGVSAVRLDDGTNVAASDVVLSAGAFTGRLSRLVGEAIPLETERGYHSQIMAPGVALRHALIWPARAFMITPTAGGIRVGGSVEMAGLDAAPNFRRARVLVEHAKAALPGLNSEGASEWMGHRPALPDTVPVIGPSAKVPGVWYATGHGHLGLTLAATTARLIGDMMLGVAPPIDMAPYRVDRF
jgi:D-amino-acid dehydrogenase